MMGWVCVITGAATLAYAFLKLVDALEGVR